MQVVVTGAQGFVGKNLCLRLRELTDIKVLPIGRGATADDWQAALDQADFVFHLAGVNRPPNVDEFAVGNAGVTAQLCEQLQALARSVPVVYASSSQAALDNPYGLSKRAAEDALFAYQQATGAKVRVYRLPNVFGKWCKPNYNSAIATFCYNTLHDLPITINDPDASLQLVYIDDLIDAWVNCLTDLSWESGFGPIAPVYETTVGEVAAQIRSFKQSRENLTTAAVGTGLVRALYSTYVSYFPTPAFSYLVPQHGDARGVFVEMLKTSDSGQFSFFTAHPGVTRGDHYHHTKTEKFLVIKGTARFGFRHVLTGETYELVTRGESSEIVETVPGWTHNITNVGDDEMIVMLWANEIFDRQKPDTIAQKV
jgi:UDP-2-acetamido-2,6-beta-L-arabino-hexul-4-ose reductase